MCEAHRICERHFHNDLLVDVARHPLVVGVGQQDGFDVLLLLEVHAGARMFVEEVGSLQTEENEKNTHVFYGKTPIVDIVQEQCGSCPARRSTWCSADATAER